MNYYNQIKDIKLPRIFDNRIRKNNLSKKPMSNYYLKELKIKNKRANSENSKSNNKSKEKNNKKKDDNNFVLNITKKKLNNINSDSQLKINKKKKKKNSPYTFKYFYSNLNKNNLQKSFSSINVNTIVREKNNLESNFMKLKNESNIYTANADYIKNKKMIILDKYVYDNNKYKPDRLGLFDMSEFHQPKIKIGKGVLGHIYYNHNKYRRDDNINENFKY